jgi:LruC domain-containing protein
MKRTMLFLFILALVALLVSCPMPLGQSQPDTGMTSGEFAKTQLPSDVVGDVVRASSASFDFQTLLSVKLSLTVNLYQKDAGALKKLAPDAAEVYVSLSNSKGKPVYGGKLLLDGTLTAVVQLPAAPEDMTLTLTADGFSARNVTISDMRRYSEVNRTMSMLMQSSGQRNTNLPDSDGDGVPDAYDAYPTDPSAAFKTNVPAEGNLSVAFEDLFGQAQAGDADYNDFFAAYKITVKTDAQNKVTGIEGEAKAIAKLAGYDHRFGIYFNHFTDTATLSVRYFDASGQELYGKAVMRKAAKEADILLFDHTKSCVGRTTKFTLSFQTPQDPSAVDLPPYNSYLFVYNTGHDIHLIGEEALPGSINPNDTYRDAEGFPWALLVPSDWKNPDECQRIEVHYPRFTLWRQSMGVEFTDWYAHYDDPYVPPPPPPPPPTNEPTVKQAADIYAGAGSSYPTNMTLYSGVLYFSANDGTNGKQLWRYDGTSVTRVSLINPGMDLYQGLSPAYLTVYNGSLYFQGITDTSPAVQLYSYNGSGAPSAPSNAINMRIPQYLRVWGTRLFMGGTNTTNALGQQLQSYDGSTVNTTPVSALINCAPQSLTVFNNLLVFSALDGSAARQLWRYDGTNPPNVVTGYSLNAGVAPGSDIVLFNGALYFRASDGINGQQLWRYDGTNPPSVVTNLDPGGIGGVSPSGMAIFNSGLYFRGTDGASGWELWKYDGSTASRVVDLNPLTGDGLASADMIVFNGALYFCGTDGTAGYQLWKYDGTNASLVKIINQNGDASPQRFQAYNNKLYFQATDGSSGVELWELSP